MHSSQRAWLIYFRSFIWFKSGKHAVLSICCSIVIMVRNDSAQIMSWAQVLTNTPGEYCLTFSKCVCTMKIPNTVVGYRDANEERALKKTYSLKKQLSYIFSACYLFLLLLLFFFDFYAIQSKYEQVNRGNIEAVNEYAEKIGRALREADTTLTELAIQNTEFEELTRFRTRSEAEQESEQVLRKYEIAYDLAQQAKGRVLGRENMDGICFSYENHKSRRYVFREGIPQEEVEKLIAWHDAGVNEDAYINEWRFLRTGESVYYARYYKRQAAAISVFVDLSNFEFDFAQYMIPEPGIVLEYEGEFAALKGKIQEMLPEGAADPALLEEEYEHYSCAVGTTPLTVHMYVKNPFLQMLDAVSAALLCITAFAIGLGVCFYVTIRKKLILPLEQLVDNLEKVRQGERELPRMRETGIEEFEQLDDTLRMMLREIRQLKIDAYEEKLSNQKVQLQYLQMQIRPHFFLNCLKTLNALAINKKYDKMQDLIYNISVHLRFLLNSETQTISLKKEMDYVRNYQELQNSMGLRQLKLEIELEEETMECPVPSLMVQTFVENTYKYARARENQNALTLKIKGVMLTSDGQRYLDLSVLDDGEGYPAYVLAVLNGQDSEFHDDVGIGIINLKKRCRLIYGERCEFFFDNMPGAFSEIVIPCTGEEEQV